MIDPDPRDLPYRRGVGLLLFNAAGLVFVARRIDLAAEAWQMPQGGIDEGESPRSAVFREMEEEIGTAKAEIIAESRDWFRYDLPPELLGRAWQGRYRGQMQKWFALRFTGVDADITLDTAHPEFNAWQWVPFDRLVDLAVPFKRALYQTIVDEFGPLAATLAGR